MSEHLLSVGLDVGTTSTQLIFSRLNMQNKAGAFSVPEITITHRQVLYQSDIHFTPLLSGDLVDAAALRTIIDAEYQKAGIAKSDVDTGAIIITGETSRKENAEAVLHQLAGFAGDFVVATAGPDLESILAAKGAGADLYSEQTGKTLLHMDIGGGTSNLALILDGSIQKTGCLNVGGRLLKFDKNRRITYLSPVLAQLFPCSIGDLATPERLQPLADLLTSALEMAAGLRQPTDLLDRLTTPGTPRIIPPDNLTLSSPAVWRTAFPGKFPGMPSATWDPSWDKPSAAANFATTSFWEKKPFGPPSSAQVPTAPNCPEVRYFTKISPSP